MILIGVDDSVVLGNQTVSTPFVGQTRYNLFTLLAPAFITALRLYVDLQLAHMVRLTPIMERRRIRPSLSLSASNSPTMWFAGAICIHLVPALSIALIGYHASALYPERGLLLYAWAVALLTWSVVQNFVLARPRPLSFAVAAVSVSALILGGLLLSSREQIAFCERRYEGIANALTAVVLRLPEFSYADLTGGHYEDANLSCGVMESTRFRAADVRFARFWFAEMNNAEFTKSTFSYAEFDGATLRHTNMSEAEGAFSQFFKTDLDESDLSKAKLTGARFNLSLLDQTVFTEATLKSASFYKAELSFVNFTSSDLRDANFDHANLTEVNFTRAQLQKSSFDGAKFLGGSFSGADLSCSSFLGASLKDVDFSGVAPGGLHGVKFPQGESMTGIRWPEGYDAAAAGTSDAPDCTTER